MDEENDDDDEHLCYRCRKIIIGLDNYVAHRKDGCCRLVEDVEEDMEPAEEGKEQDNSDLGTFSKLTGNAEQMREAAFMENIGLTITKASCSKAIESPSRGGGAPRAEDWIDPEMLTWYDQSLLGKDSGQNMSSGGKHRPQTSLLSFLNKSKANQLGLDEAAGDGGQQADFLRRIDLIHSEMHDTSTSSAGKWRLWNPETDGQVNGDDLWNDILSSAAAAAGDIYIEATTDANNHLMTESSFATGLVGASSTPTKETSEFYCSPCQRSLSTGDAYYRHKLSELHFKRANQVIDQHLCKKREPKKKIRFGETTVEEDKLLNNTPPDVPTNHQLPSATSMATTKEAASDNSRCPCCFASVQPGFFAKHLTSHFHHHRSLGHPLQNDLVLEHIEEIVRQAPYQCQPCQFYCNWSQYFEDHWDAVHCHNVVAAAEVKTYWCSFCRYDSSDPCEMRDHLRSENHIEVIAMINRAVPIIIRCIELHQCQKCEKKFRLRLSLVRHMRGPSHGLVDYMDHNFLQCDFCHFRTLIAKHLRSHVFLVHPDKGSKKSPYSCSLCRRRFTTKIASVKHKSSRTHLLAKNASKANNGKSACPLCGEEVESLPEHILAAHASEASQCCVCGKSFTLPQQLSAHVRMGGCQLPQGDSTFVSVKDGFSCPECPTFSANSRPILLLHTAVVHSMFNNADSIACPVCQIAHFTSRAKLLLHIMGHESCDMQQRCSRCSRLFATVSSLQNHYCPTTTSHAQEEDRKFSCPVPNCAYVAKRESALKSHQVIHQPCATKSQILCPLCTDFKCSRRSELHRHIRTRHGDKSEALRCDKCTYSTASKQHLSRHLLAMHGLQEQRSRFQCRKCDYTAAGMDTLRKHILKTNKHPGLSVYGCIGCSFETNAVIDFRCHLIRHHRDVLPNDSDVERLVSDYFLNCSNSP
jgi:hypothetical protein